MDYVPHDRRYADKVCQMNERPEIGEIVTDRLILTALRYEKHYLLIKELFKNDPSMFFHDDAAISAAAEHWFEKYAASKTSPVFGYRACVLKKTNQPIGQCGFLSSENPENPELGISILRPFWNKGYATEAITALMDWAEVNHSVCGFSAFAMTYNEGAKRILEKAGFSFLRETTQNGHPACHYTRLLNKRNAGS